MNKTRSALRCAALLALFATGLCHGQIVPPRPKGNHLLSLGPLYGPPRDRVIVVDLSIKSDGTVGATEVVSGFFDDIYQARALPALRRLRFEPATLNGQPTEFYGYRTVLTTRKNFTTSTHPGFERDYEKVQALTQSGDYAGAESLIQDLIKSRITTVFEYAFLNEALVPLYVKLNRPYDALRASRIASLKSGYQQAEYYEGSRILANDPNWPYFLPKESLVGALRQRFTLAFFLERFAEANAAYHELNALQPLADDDPLAQRARDLESRRRSTEPMITHAKIEHGEWEYSPTRRLISVHAASPTAIHSVDVKCALHREKRSFEPDAALLLPPPWGACTLTYTGDEGTDLVVTENMLPGPRALSP